MNTNVYAACRAGYQAAKALGFLDEQEFWLEAPDGTMFSIVKLKKSGLVTYDVQVYFNTEVPQSFGGWVNAKRRGVFKGNRYVPGSFPLRALQALRQALPMPPSGRFHGILRGGKIIALQYSWTHPEEGGAMCSTTFLLQGSKMPDIVRRSSRGYYTDPVKFHRLLANDVIVPCDELIGGSKYKVLWTKGEPDGRGNCLIVRDDWTGITGRSNLAVYQYWRATKNPVDVQKVLRTGTDIRANFR